MANIPGAVTDASRVKGEEIHFASGGDIRGMIAAHEAYLRVADDSTKVVVGHGPLAKKSDVLTMRPSPIPIATPMK